MTPEQYDLNKLIAEQTLKNTGGWARRHLICQLVVDRNPAMQGIAVCVDCRGTGCVGFEKACEKCSGAGVLPEFRTRPSE